MSTGRIFRARWSVPVGVKGRVYRATMTASAPVGSKGRIYRARMTGTAAVIVNRPANVTVGPGQQVTLTASLVGGGAADSWTYRVVSGPTPGLSGTGASRTLTGPSVQPPNPGIITIGVTAVVGAVTSTEVLTTITVLPQKSWYYTGTGWAGSRTVIV